MVTKTFFLFEIETSTGLDMGLCLILCPQKNYSEVLDSRKTLMGINVSKSSTRGSETKRVKGLHMLPSAFIMRHGTHEYHSGVVL